MLSQQLQHSHDRNEHYCSGASFVFSAHIKKPLTSFRITSSSRARRSFSRSESCSSSSIFSFARCISPSLFFVPPFEAVDLTQKGNIWIDKHMKTAKTQSYVSSGKRRKKQREERERERRERKKKERENRHREGGERKREVVPRERGALKRSLERLKGQREKETERDRIERAFRASVWSFRERHREVISKESERGRFERTREI